MSLNKPTCMKLRFHDDLRKLSRLPTSFSDLRSLVSVWFGPQNFVYRYLDEEGDLVTMASDQELGMACETAQGPSLKVFLSLPGETRPDQTSMSSKSSVGSADSPLDELPVGKHSSERPDSPRWKIAKKAMLAGLVQ